MPELSEHFRQAILATVPCAVFVLDNDGRILFWNRAAEELTGYLAPEMRGRTCEALHVRPSSQADPAVLKALCMTAPTGQTEQTECELVRKDGTVVPVLRRSQTVRDAEGRPVGIVHAAIDIRFIRQAGTQIRRLEQEVARAGRFGDMVGASPAMRRLYEAIELVAPTDASVVIEGPTGTGKELVARTIHARSRRAEQVFLPVNCGALPETLLEAELFGHVRGAFTGAVADRAGRFEEASGGTLLLDEVTEMSPASQVKLLRVLQEGEITRVGESVPRKVDVRVIAATNRDLAEEIEEKRFREDLYYRLRVVGLHVPPLARRRGDIPDLVAHFLGRLNVKYGRQITACSAGAMGLLSAHDWPGNVRQLEHALEHAFVVTPAGRTVIEAAALPPEISPSAPRGVRRPAVGDRARPPAGKADEKAHVLDALQRAEGNKAQAARMLGITRAGLYKRMKRLGIGG